MITKFNFQDRTIKSYAIRKLTPKECFRLMGVKDSVISVMQSRKVEGGDEMLISASQQYKQAGNSIVVDVLVYVYEQLWYPVGVETKRELSFENVLFPDDVLPDSPPPGKQCRREDFYNYF